MGRWSQSLPKYAHVDNGYSNPNIKSPALESGCLYDVDRALEQDISTAKAYYDLSEHVRIFVPAPVLDFTFSLLPFICQKNDHKVNNFGHKVVIETILEGKVIIIGKSKNKSSPCS